MPSPVIAPRLPICLHSYLSTAASADVHILLGDIGMEQEAFDGALADYSNSIQLLEHEKVGASLALECHTGHFEA